MGTTKGSRCLNSPASTVPCCDEYQTGLKHAPQVGVEDDKIGVKDLFDGILDAVLNRVGDLEPELEMTLGDFGVPPVEPRE